MNAVELSQWYYLMYLLPGGAALLLMLMSVAGGGHHRIGGGHHHGGGMGRSGLRHAGPKHGGPKQSVRGQAAKPSPAYQALALLGIGRAPGLLVWGSLLLGWGLCGFWATRLLEPALRIPLIFCLPALAVALLGALGAARLTSLLWTRLLPAEETFVIGTVDLCGLTGKVVFPVDETRGRVHVYDAFGTLHDVSARVAPGQPSIPRGSSALVTDFDDARGVVIIEDLP